MIRLLIILLLFWCSNAFAITDTFQEGVSGYAGTKDAILQSASTNQHTTNSAQMRELSTIPYILYFDISTIPASATVSSATIQLYVSEQNCTDEIMGVRSIQNPDNSGSFDANTAAADVFNDYATWAYKDHGVTTAWKVGGAAGNFTDVYNNANENTQTSGACPGYVLKTWTVTNMVQGWVTTPNSNGGMVFSTADVGRVDIRSRFYVTSTERPLLTVNYTSVIKNVSITGGNIKITDGNLRLF